MQPADPHLTLALRRAYSAAFRRYESVPRGTRQQALALWDCLVKADTLNYGALLRLRAPSLSVLADGAVSLAREQAARGVRTIDTAMLSGTIGGAP